MIPWSRLPHHVQETILGLVLISGAGSLVGCTTPLVCDPPPPPSLGPAPSPTRGPTMDTPTSLTKSAPTQPPVIYDPAPPPRTATRTLKPPIICDPAPPPSPRSVGGQLTFLKVTPDETVSAAKVKGRVVSADGNPRAGVLAELISNGPTLTVTTSFDGTFNMNCPPGDYVLIIGRDREHTVNLQLKDHDVADVVWTLSPATPAAMLPLAEIRTVDIVWSDDLTFEGDTLWPGANFRWMTTGGELLDENGVKRWVPPSLPGRYLVQLIADWGYEGLAVDAVTLTVFPNGSVFIT